MAKLFFNCTRELTRTFKTGKAFAYLIFTPDLPLDQAFLVTGQSSEDQSISDMGDLMIPENTIKFIPDGDELKILDDANKIPSKSIVDGIKTVCHGKDKTYAITAFLKYISPQVFDLWCSGSFMEYCLEMASRKKLKGMPTSIPVELGAEAYFMIRNLPKEQKLSGIKAALAGMPLTVSANTIVDPDPDPNTKKEQETVTAV